MGFERGLLLINSSITSSSSLVKRALSSQKDPIAQRLAEIIKAIKRQDPSNLYMQKAEESMQANNFDKASNYINAHYCNETYQALQIARQNKAHTDKILQAQIKERFDKKDQTE